MADRKPVQFRAIASTRRPGTLTVQHSRNGDWEGSVDGLSADDVAGQFTKLKARGAVIVDTEDYKHA